MLFRSAPGSKWLSVPEWIVHGLGGEMCREPSLASRTGLIDQGTGRPWADATGAMEDGWEADGEMVRSAYTARPGDDDFTQPGVLVREVFDEDQRSKLIDQVSGSLLAGVREPVLSRALNYWKNVDCEVGRRIEAKVRFGA